MPRIAVKEIDQRKSIGQVAKELGVETYVLRFWETKFDQIKPIIGNGDRRYYFTKEIDTLKKIKYFLHDEGYTIAGLQKLLSSKNSDNYKEKDLKYLVNKEHNPPIQKEKPQINDNKKEEVRKIIDNIEIKLQKFRDLIR